MNRQVNRTITGCIRTAMCILTLGILPLIIVVAGGFGDLTDFITAEDVR